MRSPKSWRRRCNTARVSWERASVQHRNPARDLPPVRADFARVKDVLVRLIENANVYTPQEQPITIYGRGQRRPGDDQRAQTAGRESTRWSWA